MRPTGTRDDVELSNNQKFVCEKIMTECVKKEINIDENYQRACAIFFGQCTEHMRS